MVSSEKRAGGIEEDLRLSARSDMGRVGSGPAVCLRLNVMGDPVGGSWRKGDEGRRASSCHLALSSSSRCISVNSASFCLARSCLTTRKSFSAFVSLRVRFWISCFDASRFLSISWMTAREFSNSPSTFLALRLCLNNY